MTVEPCQRVLPEELRRFDLFKEDDDAAIEWLAQLFEVKCYEPGQMLIDAGDPVNTLAFVMEGGIEFSRPDNPSIGVFKVGVGDPFGKLPFSRMKVSAGRGYASAFTRVAQMDVSNLRELVYRAPNLAGKLVGQMTDRTREFTQMSERNSKMLALGKLSAGLAHELNNPASAVVRSATTLREMLLERRRNAVAIRTQFLPESITKAMNNLMEVAEKAAKSPIVLDELERSDLDAETSDWLEKHGLDSQKASDLISMGITPKAIEPMLAEFDRATVDKMFSLLVADQQMLVLISEVEEAARRMSQLVKDVKSYSYMDTSPLADVDIEEGIRATLRMFQHQLKDGFTVKKNFAQSLPRVHANGNELNQIWTNLIDNAIDAMKDIPEGQRVLEIRTVEQPRYILVEIIDNGKGIPKDVQGRIFEPFFTTKGVGEGTGLGLDIVQRIVRNHQGTIEVESKPGRTCFRIQLPK